MKILYFDCFSGISGDMTLGALLDLGIDKNEFLQKLSMLNLDGYEIEITKKEKMGIFGTDVSIKITQDSCHHRHLKDILNIISKSSLPKGVCDLSTAIFKRLGLAEAKVHNKSIDEIHFHEVGAVDSILDIVGTAICLDIIKPDVIYSSRLTEGCGFVLTQHGKLPVPVPATCEILSNVNAPIHICDIESEMITPTGAAIIGEVVSEFKASCDFNVTKIGYGLGKKDFKIPNMLRVLVGNLGETTNVIASLETNLDDITGEIMGYTMEKLFENGALDVFFTPIYMKKNRPSYMLSVLCDVSKINIMEEIIFLETKTLGIRKQLIERSCLERKIVTKSTKYGEVSAKQAYYKNIVNTKTEYEDAKKIAKEKNIPLFEIL